MIRRRLLYDELCREDDSSSVIWIFIRDGDESMNTDMYAKMNAKMKMTEMERKGRHILVNGLRIAALLLLVVFIWPGAFGSPAYDFTVAKDGSGSFSTVQEAVTACRDFAERDYRIFVKKGVYEEKLVIPSWKRRITITGENVDSTIITWSDYSGKADKNGNTLNTFTSYTCLVAGNDIVMENLTFVNASGRVGQAVALHVEGDRCIFRNCRLIGDQDTLFASGEQSRQYFDECHIEGTTDFIFGASTAVFRKCTILCKKDSYITAASTSARREYGFVFLDCRILADTGVASGCTWDGPGGCMPIRHLSGARWERTFCPRAGITGTSPRPRRLRAIPSTGAVGRVRTPWPGFPGRAS